MQMLQRSSQYSIFYSRGEVRIRSSTEITWRLLEGIQFYFLEKPQQTCLVKRCCDRLLVQYQERFACQPGLPVGLFGMCAIRDVLFEMGSMVLVRTGLTWWSVSASGYNPPEQQSNVGVSLPLSCRGVWRGAEQSSRRPCVGVPALMGREGSAMGWLPELSGAWGSSQSPTAGRVCRWKLSLMQPTFHLVC